MIVLALSGILVYRQVREVEQANEWVLHTHNVIETTNKSLLALMNAESRLNYYLLTSNSAVLQELRQSAQLAQLKTNSILDLTQDNIIQNARAKELLTLVNQKIALMEKIIKNHISNKNTAFEIASSQERENTKQRIATLANEINQEEINLLVQRNQNELIERHIVNVMLSIFVLLSELLLLLSLIFLNYSLYKRKAAEEKRDELEKELIKANENLKISDERYRLSVEGTAAGLWDWEVGTDKVYYSPYMRKILGYTEDEFPNSLVSFENIIHPQDHDRLWQVVDQHLEQHAPFKAEYRLRISSGKYNWFRAAGQAIWNEQGVPVRMAGSLIDIDAAKKAEQSLSIQNNISNLLSDANSLEEVAHAIIKNICEELKWGYGAIWKVDSENRLVCIDTWYHSPKVQPFDEETKNTVFTYGTVLPGKVWQQKKALWFTDIIHDKEFTRARIAKEVGLYSAFAFPIRYQDRILGVFECYSIDKELPDKNILQLMDMVGNQIGLVLTRKAAENKLRESEEYKTAIFQAANDCIITLDNQNKIVSFNLQTIKEFGYSAEKLIYLDIHNLVPKLDLNIYTIKSNIDLDARRENGIFFPVEISISRMKINQKDMAVIVLRNVTERKRIERMKNEFISVVSHELRTPLTSIRGALSLIAGGMVGKPPVEMQKLLDIANNNCERLLLLISDILDVEKLQESKMNFKIVNFLDLVKEAVSNNKPYSQKFNVTLELHENNEDIQLKVDPDRLMQVLNNLISNAIKFSDPHESVVITIKKYKESMRFLITNKGPGIPIDLQVHIFDKFVQADTSTTRSKGGTGLGLNISKTIIERLGGTLNFISKINEITTFYFDLPLYLEKEKIEEEKELTDFYDKKQNLLICEDDEQQARYLGCLLEKSGFHIDIAHNVPEAKHFLSKHNYHALLLDLILPGEDGISFIRELHDDEKYRNLPIIVLSVIAQTGQHILFDETVSVQDWLSKPINFDRLLVAINHIKNKAYPKRASVLYVEDDMITFRFIKALLQDYAEVFLAKSIKETLEILDRQSFNLIILDLLLPDGNSESILPKLETFNIPIIVYSGLKVSNNLGKIVKHVVLKSEISNEKLLNLIKLELKVNG